MNAKNVNRLFLAMLIVEIAVLVFLLFFGQNIVLGVVPNLLLSQLIMVVPAVLFVLFTKQKWKEIVPIKILKPSTVVMIIILTYLTMPLVTFINALTMLYSDNVVSGMQEQILQQPFWVMYLVMALVGPFCEEFVFRGIIYGGYRKTSNVLVSVFLSALIFGMIHMNLNQAPYAFAIGVILAVLKEITGSFLAPLIYHVIFNGHTVVLLYLSKKIVPEFSEAMQTAITSEQLLFSICIYAVLALITTAIAVCVLVWINGNEKGNILLKDIWNKRKEKLGKTITPTFVIAFLLCIVLMIITF